MFRRAIATSLIATLVGVTIGAELFRHPTATTPGTVVAYYENSYQQHAIKLLMDRKRINEWPCLYTLWTRESHWNPHALNKKSKAYGIAQFMPKTWQLVGSKRTSDGYKQVELGLLYINRRYGETRGSVCRALGSSLARGWY